VRCFYQNGIKSVVWRVKIKEERDHLFFQALSVDGWILAFRLDVHRLCVAIEEKLGHFLSRWLKMGSQSVVSRGKIPWNNPPWSGFKPVPRRGQTMRYILSPTELSWPGPRRGQTMRYILPLLSYHDPGHGEDRQWDTSSPYWSITTLNDIDTNYLTDWS